MYEEQKFFIEFWGGKNEYFFDNISCAGYKFDCLHILVYKSNKRLNCW